MGHQRKWTKDEMAAWPIYRIKAKKILEMQSFEYTLMCLIMINLVMLVVETDLTQMTGSRPQWMEVVNRMMLIIFLIELIVRIYVYRIFFFSDPMCWIDAVVVVLDLASAILDSYGVSGLRILRMVRMSRASSIVDHVPELSMLVRSLTGAIKPIFWGSAILVFMLGTWGVLAVNFIHPLNEELTAKGYYTDCERCPRAYKSVIHSSVTIIQQIIAGDSWGLVTLPIIEHYPPAAIFFIAMFISLQVALMNVVLACVVDSATQARTEDLRSESAKLKLQAICREIDGDGSGEISFDELMDGFQNNRDFKRTMMEMNIQDTDIQVVWDIVDEDQSGSCSYEEFVGQLLSMKSTNPHTMLMMIRHYVSEIRSKINDQGRLIKREIQKETETGELVNELLHDVEGSPDKIIKEVQHMQIPLEQQVNHPRAEAMPEAKMTLQGQGLAQQMTAPEPKEFPFMSEQRQFMNEIRGSIKELERKFVTLEDKQTTTNTNPAFSPLDSSYQRTGSFDPRCQALDPIHLAPPNMVNSSFQVQPRVDPAQKGQLWPVSSCCIEPSSIQHQRQAIDPLAPMHPGMSPSGQHMNMRMLPTPTALQ